jgi:uncharacterized protein
MLTEFIEPIQLGKEQKILAGELSLKSFERSRDLLLVAENILHFTWRFDIDQHDQVTALLTLKADLSLECQRCQKPFSYHLDIDIPMKVVRNELEAEALPLALQPLYIDAMGQCESLQVIEDEFILSIPEFPKHEKKDCDLGQNQAYYDTPSNGIEQNTYKPFANLKLLSKEKK